MKRTLAFLAVLALAACGGAPQDEASAPAGPSFELSGLGLQVVELPLAWTEPDAAAKAGAETVEFRRNDGEAMVARVHLEPEGDDALNLVQVLQGEPERWEAFDEGKFNGVSAELTTHLGPAYLARGQRSVEGTLHQSLLLFTKHPARNQLLLISLEFPSGEDRQERQADLLSFAESIDLAAPPAAS